MINWVMWINECEFRWIIWLPGSRNNPIFVVNLELKKLKMMITLSDGMPRDIIITACVQDNNCVIFQLSLWFWMRDFLLAKSGVLGSAIVHSSGSLAILNPPTPPPLLLLLLLWLGEPLLGGLGEMGGWGEVRLEPWLLDLDWGGVKLDTMAALVW